MRGRSSSVLSRLVDWVFPQMPDFYGLMNEQCDTLVEAMEAFVKMLENGGREEAINARALLERRGNELKARNVDILNCAFVSQTDRLHFCGAVITLDMILNCAKTTGREMEALGVTPDEYMLEIAVELKNGVHALRQGFGKLTSSPAQADASARAAREVQRNVGKIHRRARAELSHAVDGALKKLDATKTDSEPEGMLTVVDMLKRREIYRHLSDGAKRVVWAADRLHAITVNIA